MVDFIVPFTGNLTLFVIIVFVFIVIISVSVLIVRSHIAKKGAKSPQMAAKPVKKIDKSSSDKQQVRSAVEAKPAISKELSGSSSLGELASKIGVKHLLFFNQFGVPIESYNFNEERRFSALLAEFVSTMRRLNPDFNSTFSEDGYKLILLSVDKVGEIEVFALAVCDSEMKLKAEEVRDFFRTYLLESLGRSR